MLWLKSYELPRNYECVGISLEKMCVCVCVCILQSSLYSIKHLRIAFSICSSMLIHVPKLQSIPLEVCCDPSSWPSMRFLISAGFVNSRNCKLLLEYHRQSTTVLFSVLSVWLGRKRGLNKLQLPQYFVASIRVFGSIPYLEQICVRFRWLLVIWRMTPESCIRFQKALLSAACLCWSGANGKTVM